MNLEHLFDLVMFCISIMISIYILFFDYDVWAYLASVTLTYLTYSDIRDEMKKMPSPHTAKHLKNKIS